jgi:hypothetical protein
MTRNVSTKVKPTIERGNGELSSTTSFSRPLERRPIRSFLGGVGCDEAALFTPIEKEIFRRLGLILKIILN